MEFGTKNYFGIDLQDLRFVGSLGSFHQSSMLAVEGIIELLLELYFFVPKKNSDNKIYAFIRFFIKMILKSQEQLFSHQKNF